MLYEPNPKVRDKRGYIHRYFDLERNCDQDP